MSVLVFAESSEGKLVKASFEAVSYGAKLASDAGTELNVISFGGASDEELSKLGNYGAGKIMVERNGNEVQPFQMASIVEEAATRVGADTIIFSYDVKFNIEYNTVYHPRSQPDSGSDRPTAEGDATDCDAEYTVLYFIYVIPT